MTVRQLIPQGLAEMAPGPELAVLLAGIDMSALTGADAVGVLCARHRQLSHDQAQLLAAMVEVGLSWREWLRFMKAYSRVFLVDFLRRGE